MTMAIIEYKGLKIDTDTLTKEDMPTEVFEEIFDLCGADVAVHCPRCKNQPTAFPQVHQLSAGHSSFECWRMVGGAGNQRGI